MRIRSVRLYRYTAVNSLQRLSGTCVREASINAVETVEKRAEMARKWWSFLHRCLQSNAETYFPLGNHTEGRLCRSKLAGGEAGDLSGIMGVESTVKSDAGKGDFAGTSSRTIQRR